ncbi:MAG: 3'-5' exonuclease [Saprospiraceae bacterium]
MIFIVYDLEATCWKGRPPSLVQEIIEIGAVKINGYGEVLGQFNAFVRPVVNPMLSSFCQELTGINQVQVNRASRFDRVVEDFLDWIEDEDEDFLLCSWGSFDKKMLIQDCKLHDYEFDWVENHINVKRQYQNLKRLRTPRGLHKTVETEGFEFEGDHHRAIADAINLAKVFIKYLDEWVY